VGDYADNTFDDGCPSKLRIGNAEITADVTLPAKFSPYRYLGTIKVYEEATVVIEPGTRFEIYSSVINGVLKAVGTEYSRIVFECAKTPQIFDNALNLSKSGAGTIIDYCEFRNFDIGIQVFCCSPIIRNTKFEGITRYGIYFYNDNYCTTAVLPPVVESCLFSDIGKFGIYFGNSYSVVPDISKCVFNLPYEKRVSGIPADRDTDGDLMPDSWEIAYGLNMMIDDSQQDNDGDGVTNLNEYRAHTDPTDSQSAPFFSPSILLLLFDN
jgi:hypothetical protein